MLAPERYRMLVIVDTARRK